MLEYWSPYPALLTPSYDHFTKLMGVKLGDSNVVVGLEWEHGPRFIPILLQRIKSYGDNLMFKYAVSVYMRGHVYDSSDPDEYTSVPPVPLYVDGNYIITPLIRQSALLAVLDLPHNYCPICGRHIHISMLTGGSYVDFSEDEGIMSLPLSDFHKLMYGMASVWSYDRGVYRYGFRPRLPHYAKANRYIDTDHYSAININVTSWPKPVTIEIRYNEVVPIVSLPAVVYAVEYLIRRNETVLHVDPNSDEYFDRAVELCNNPLCAEIIRSVRDYVISKKHVYWDWNSIRAALGHVIDDQLYRMLDYIEDFMDETPAVTADPNRPITYIGFSLPTTCRGAKPVKPFKSFIEFLYSESLNVLVGEGGFRPVLDLVECFKLANKDLVEEIWG